MFTGIAECVGNAITFEILTRKMKIINRSIVRSAIGTGMHQNERANALAPEFAPSVPTHLVNVKGKLYPVNAKVIQPNAEPGSKVDEMDQAEPDHIDADERR